MAINRGLQIVIGLVSVFSVFILLGLTLLYLYGKKPAKDDSGELGKCQEEEVVVEGGEGKELQSEDLISFQGGEDLTIHDILDAPGEVVGKSAYGTLYKAMVERNKSVKLLRFLRPACTGNTKESFSVIETLGCIRHPNLVPLQAFYSGARGEKLLVHPFYIHGSLAQYLQDGTGEAYKWGVIYRITLGIVKGLDHLHTGLEKPVIHGNLKSKNIFLDSNRQPYLSDYGLHLLVNLKTSQEMLEASSAQGYKAPELIKMKDASKESDIYSLGVILLELLTGKEPVNINDVPGQELYLPNSMRNAIIDHRIKDVYHPNLSHSLKNHPKTSEECLLVYFRLAMACCSPSPSIRPDIKQVLSKVVELGP